MSEYNFKYTLDTGPTEAEQKTAEVEEVSVEDEDVVGGGKLKKKDLLEYENLNKIRSYMIARKGVDYKDKEGDAVVEDFVDHMRFFNTNIVSTGGEVRFISKADDKQKALAKDAYDLYDDLGNVFVNDGFFGAVDGVKDYILAAASDPTNYLGLMTGGLGKAAAYGATQGGKAFIKQVAKEAGERAVREGLDTAAQKKAVDTAVSRATTRLVEKGVKGPTADRVIKNVATKEKEIFLAGAREGAERTALEGVEKKAQRYSLYGTAALDGTFAMLNDYQIQNVMLDVGSQEEYSSLQTTFSFGLGAVGAGAQLLGRAGKGKSGLGDTAGQLERGAIRQEIDAEIAAALPPKEIKRSVEAINKAFDSWETKWKRGSASYDPEVTPTNLVHDIMLGENGKGGLAKIFKDNKMQLGRNATVSDVMTNLVRQIPEDELATINTKLQGAIGVSLGDYGTAKITLGDLLAKDIRSSAQMLNIMSQTRKTIDGGLAHGTAMIDSITGRTDIKKAIAEEEAKAGRAKLGQYGQSVWRRLLVSSPATTAVNVMGFGQYAAGQALSDMFSSTSLMTASLFHGNSAKGKELRRIAGVYKTMQGQRMKNLMDPFTTHDAYMSFLEQHKDISKTLFESFSGGVERSSKRFGIDEDAKWFKRTEKVTEAMNRLTGVKIQDTFTKSQMFMTELDKHLRINKNKSLQDVLADGTLNDIDDGVLSLALDTTLKSVYSKNYTGQDQLLGQMAKGVESISNMPLIGTILPFGRFFNNVIATTYQHSPLAMVESATRIASSQLKQTGTKISDIEAFSRATVGTTALVMAMQFDEERQDKNLGVYDMDIGGGTIIDAKNTFPFSLWLVAGRVGNLMRKGETVNKELITELTSQLAVGQLASDAQFGNDLTNIVDTILNQEEGGRKLALSGLAKAGGNFAAGFTRPLDAVNKLTGFITETDTAKDARQAKTAGAVFTQSSTKYFDNIIEAFIGEVDTLTGEQLNVASRKGEIYDANPLARIFGITVKRGRNSTEKAYSMANMAEWTASERSQMAEYDKVFNSYLAPVLERSTDKLLRDRRFIEGDSDQRKDMLRKTLTEAKSEIREYTNEYAPGKTQLLAMRRKANMVGSKELRTKALRAMKTRYNFEGAVSEMTYKELKFFMDYVDTLEDYLKQ